MLKKKHLIFFRLIKGHFDAEERGACLTESKNESFFFF